MTSSLLSEGYQRLRETAAIVDRDDLAWFRMWGRDPVRMLNGLISNDLTLASQERAVFAAMLTPKGKMLADLRAFPTGATEVFFDAAMSAAPVVADHLRKFVPPLFAKWERVDGGTLGVYGPKAGEVVSTALESDIDTDTEDALRLVKLGDEMIAALATASAGEVGFDLFVPTKIVADIRDRLLETAAGVGGGGARFEAFEVARIEAGRPRFGIDMTEDTLPAEAFESTGLMKRAVSFQKGCYTGQEVVVRIAHRGHVNRQLRGILLGDAALPAPSTPLTRADSEKEIGFTTSAAQSPMMGQAIALAYVRREVASGEKVQVGGAIGIVTDLPFRRP